MKVLIVYPNLPLMLVPGIAIGLFTRILRETGAEVDLFETTHYDTAETNFSQTSTNFAENRVKLLSVRPFSVEKDLGVRLKSTSMLEDFRAKVESFRPDLMIFSVVEDTFLQARSMLRRVEDLGIPHLLGGVFPTMAPAQCLAAPEVRMIAPGEGEDTVTAVVEAIRAGTPLERIDGTWTKSASGEIIRNPQRPLVDINRYRPDFTLFDPTRFMRPIGGRVFKQVPVETYRGCPYSCTYCNSPSQRAFSTTHGLGSFLRRKSMETLRAELRAHVEELSPGMFYFIDDSFLARPRDEIFAFCDMYEDFRLPFHFNNRAEQNDAEVLARLKRVGCYRISLGLEAGNEQYRQKVLRRKITNAELIRRFGILADSGIAFSLNVIIGHPGETREMVMDTVEVVRAIQGYDAITCFTFTPYHGTVQRDTAIRNGWLAPEVVSHHVTSRSLLRMPPPMLNADEIDGLMATFPLYCYFPKSEWKMIRRAESNDEEGLRIRQEYGAIYARNFFGETQDSPKIYPDGPTSHWGKDPQTYFTPTPDRIDAATLARLALDDAPRDAAFTG